MSQTLSETSRISERAKAIVLFCVCATTVNAIIPQPQDGATLDELIEYYFSQLYTQDEILGFLLFLHNVMISKRTLKRILRRLNLRRRGVENLLPDIVRKIVDLRRFGYDQVGYRTMWRLLNTLYGVRATQETVRIALSVIDTDGVNARRRRRLIRRSYNSRGPNDCLHVDGYDKLKPFGISIHGCIDGFSRKIMWLTASHTNKNPRYVARYFVEHLKKYKRVPRSVRTDAGTENVLIHRIQMALRYRHRDPSAGVHSVSVGRSTANQRIEMLWSFLMRNFTIFWKNLFNSLVEEGILNNTDPLHLECVRFCFLPIIQLHLNQFEEMWNTHRIRQQGFAEQCYGIPNVMYFQPIIYGKLDQSFALPCGDTVLDDIADQYTEQTLHRGVSHEFRQLVSLVTGLTIEDFDVVQTPDEAKTLYRHLISLMLHTIFA
ncbi:unnamed protein product [Mytilus edulis]|uniref:Integrase core domain-containing protein n=1 Tax=Mytilus edulis TaxID=6550 RepID=A0A8S3QS44_MYTED|nr:unnamed protein product [Mytilus edulis]